ncbi:hypothetical protein PUR71_08910 [Streptomyces sp. SP17BM10]|uniref:hypothetical protein n=1 Tax=Streptomyces sp. SP17BM10 TaxID=3002530 RepID=UPI002E772911|nr:hypothetical protein [Streptomyces sp. SP17BM10]MEE1783034.1 hypothetical protein [Streptomyces sp. SP17BM10]
MIHADLTMQMAGRGALRYRTLASARMRWTILRCRLDCAAGSAVRAVAGPAVGPSPHRPDRGRSVLSSCPSPGGGCPCLARAPAVPACPAAADLPTTEHWPRSPPTCTRSLRTTWTTGTRLSPDLGDRLITTERYCCANSARVPAW